MDEIEKLQPTRQFIKCTTLIVFGLFSIAGLMLASISYGITSIELSVVYDAFFAFNESRDHFIIIDTRVPRAVIAMAVGACLAVSGVIMQVITRNPLAAPEILGINYGAALFVTFGSFVLGVQSIEGFTWLAFLGAAITASIVFTIGSAGRDGATPLKLTLAGVALTTLCESLIHTIMILHERTLDEMRIWLAGSIVGRDLQHFQELMPYMAVGLILALGMGTSLNLLSMGKDVAVGLGQRVFFAKSLALLTVIILAGSSVAIAGPIAFIGLAVPHMARSMIGSDCRLLLPFSAIMGSILLLSADIASRFIFDMQEVPVGVMTAIVGVPFFIYLAKSRVHKL